MNVVCSLSNLNFYEQTKLVEDIMKLLIGQGFDSPLVHSNILDGVLIMNKETQLKVLNLELTKQELLIKNLSKKIQRLEKANERVYNAISQEEIDDLKLELETLEIQKKIIQSKIRDVS